MAITILAELAFLFILFTGYHNLQFRMANLASKVSAKFIGKEWERSKNK
jgi:hypothetical protein